MELNVLTAIYSWLNVRQKRGVLNVAVQHLGIAPAHRMFVGPNMLC